jgi:hypothetical protein
VKVAVNVSGVEDLVAGLKYLHTKDGRKLARITLQAGLNVIGKQMQKDLDPKVKEAGKAVGKRVAIYRQNITRAKVGFNVGKDAKKVPFRRKRTSRGGIGIGPANIHWYLSGTGQRVRYGMKGGRSRKEIAAARGATRPTGQMPAQQPGLASNAARAVLPEVRAAMQRAGKRFLEERAKKIEKKLEASREQAEMNRLLKATGKG